MLETSPDNERKSFVSSSGEKPLQPFPPIRKRSEITPAEYNDLFAEAQRNLVKEEMFELFVKAITDKETTGSNDKLAFLQNRIIQECANLSLQDAELVLDQFNRAVQQWFVKKISKAGIDSRVYSSISTGKYTHGDNNIDIRGIKNVISFLREQSLKYETSESVGCRFYFNEWLDARRMIDVIMELRRGDEVEIVLVQIKSSPPSGSELEKIRMDHERWAGEEWFDLEGYERSFISDGTLEEVESFLKNKEEVEEALMDFCTNPNSRSLDDLLRSLHLSGLNNREKAWILRKHLTLIKEQINIASEDGYVDLETKDSILEELGKLSETLERKVRLPKAQFLVGKIRSVVAVGSKILPDSEYVFAGKSKLMSVN
ncbi:MAG: hypothetical protein AAB392_01155 [Patescibacteria group bacterium]